MPPSPADNLSPAHQHHSVIDWASALDEHQRWLRTVVRCRVADVHAVDDVMQEVALRSQLGLKEGVGIVVNAVFDDSPAEKAGIKKYDVLVEVDAETLHKAEDLIEAVQQAGKEEEKLSLTVMHGGKKRSVEVAPTQRKVLGISVSGSTELQDDDEGRVLLHLEEWEPSELHRWPLMYSIGPGVVTAKTKARDAEIRALKAQMEALSTQIKALQTALKKLEASD